MMELEHEGAIAVNLRFEGRLLGRYVYVSSCPAEEAPRPFFHPLNSLAGDTLTNFRPNDHPWHHGLSLTLNQVSGITFWGGPTFVRDQGYQRLANQGAQHHIAWLRQTAAGTTASLAHQVDWRSGGDVLLREERNMDVAVDAPAKTWTLRWRSRLENVTARPLSLGNPHSAGGLVGSHYTGLQFRGARELLDEHLDPAIKIVAEGGLAGVEAVHGAPARWMEWHGQLDTTLRRVRVRFENNTGPLHWFVRRHAPLAALPLQYDRNLDLAPGATFAIDHTLTFTDL